MIQHIGGPWDQRYYDILAYLMARKLMLLLRKADADLVTWPEVAAMVAAAPPASGGFLDNVIDAAASGAAQSMIQGVMFGRVPDMNSLGQGALRGALNGDSAGGSARALLGVAAGGTLGGAVQNLSKNPQAILRAAATGAAIEGAGSLLSGSNAGAVDTDSILTDITVPSAARDTSKDCATLTKILASRYEIAAKHGEEKAAQVMLAARKKFEEYGCR